MASSIQLNSTNNSEMKIEYQGTSGVPKTVVVPDRDMTLGSEITLGTAVTASGTSVDFTGIPSGVKRITVMFNGVSTNGTSVVQVQLGTSSGVETTGYSSSATASGGTPSSLSSTTGIVTANGGAASVRHGALTIYNFNTLTWVSNHSQSDVVNNYASAGGGSKTLSGTLDRIRITTVNGTDTFDAGTINISWEF